MSADPSTVVAGLSAAVAAAGAVGLAAHPPRRLGGRVRPFAQLARSRLGTGSADAAVLHVNGATGHPVTRVLGPPLRRLAQVLSDLLDAGGPAVVELRLRQAGYSDVTADQYRMRQLGWAAGGCSLGVALGMMTGQPSGVVLLLGGLLGFPGATRWRSRLTRAIDTRRSRMRVELTTIAQVLAVYARTGHGPVEAVREVVRRGRGEVVAELAEALGWITGGSDPRRAYEQLAERTPEPAAARLYRILGSAIHSGGDIARTLLAFADDLRAEQGEEIARRAIRRRSAMLVPLLVLVAPVMLLFVAAGLPHVIFGR
ncbi:MAG TPA: type II secretion system F family protein [Acidimicrobiia bacterium]|nr:type II secretion system F family protein [Acidimicrobiia bacterium]